jgi:DtxR family Mn-dependent transcriptional regulator
MAEPTVSAVMEDYLEAILQLVRRKGAARVRDIAKALTVHKSTVTASLRNLADKGLVHYSPYETTTLTRQGRQIAEQVAQSHAAIREFLNHVLLVPEDIAEQNACRMEHVMDPNVLQRLILFAQFLKEHPESGKNMNRRLKKYLQQKTTPARRHRTKETK